MKKTVSILTSVLLTLTPLKSQFWKFIEFESDITESSFTALHFISAEEGWVAGTEGKIFYTSDGGQTWIDQSIPYDTRIYTIEFITATTGFLSTNMGIFTSHDGGISWRFTNDEIQGGYFKSIGFYDENIGWTLDGQDVYKTINGGNSWQEVDVQTGPIANYFVYPLTADTCFITGSVGYIYSTYDGGENWNVERPIPNTLVSNIHFFDNCFAQLFAYGKVFWTDDCGESYTDWNDVPIGRISMISENEGWIMNGVHGVNNLYHTTDKWNSLEKLFFANFSGLNEFSFKDVDRGWAVGDRQSILKSIDGGNTWSVSMLEGPEMNSVYYYDANNKWSVGEQGLIYFKGLSDSRWILIESPVSTNLNSVYFTSEQNGWITGDFGVLLKTSNQGRDWELVDLDINTVSLNSVFLNGRYGIITGDRGTILTTSDFGESWVQIDSESDSDLVKGLITDDNMFIAIGTHGAYLSSQNNGNSWDYISDFESSSTLKSISFSSVEDGWVISQDGIMYKTDDGGASWVQKATFNGLTMNDIEFTSEATGWIIGDNGVLLHTSDGGQNWRQDDFNISLNLNSVSFNSVGTGYIVGEKGTFLQHLQFTVSTNNLESDKELNIYPNPAGDHINIMTNNTIGSIINIEVYDLYGRSMRNISNLYSPTVTLDLQGFNSGTYIIKVTCENSTTSKQFIVQ